MVARRMIPVVMLITVMVISGCNFPGSSTNAKNQTAVAGTLTAIQQSTITAAVTPSPTTTNPPSPTVLPPTAEAPSPAATQPLPTVATNAPTAGVCDAVKFIQDITIPDGTTVTPGQIFTKTWRLQNVGTCAWTTSYKLVFTSGEQMGGAPLTPLVVVVNPGQIIDLSVTLKAPVASGLYRGNWMLENGSGARFGLAGGTPFWVEINVAGSVTATSTSQTGSTFIPPLITLQPLPPIITLQPTVFKPIITLVKPPIFP